MTPPYSDSLHAVQADLLVSALAHRPVLDWQGQQSYMLGVAEARLAAMGRELNRLHQIHQRMECVLLRVESAR